MKLCDFLFGQYVTLSMAIVNIVLTGHVLHRITVPWLGDRLRANK